MLDPTAARPPRRPPAPPHGGSGMRRFLMARGAFGALALGLAAAIGGTVGAGLAAVTGLYLAATLYWFLRLRAADRDAAGSS